MSKTRKVQYNGNIYNSTGELITSLMSNGGKLSVIITSDKNYTKSIMQYRLYSDERTFLTITKFQAKKWLSDYQKSEIAIYDEVKDLLKKEGLAFGRQLDNRKTLAELCEKDTKYELYKLIIQTLKSAVL